MPEPTPATCPWCWREGHHAPDCEGLRRFFAGEAAPVRPPDHSDGKVFPATSDDSVAPGADGTT